MKHLAPHLLVALAAWAPGVAHATQTSLSYSAAVGCPSRESFVALVERRGGSFDELRGAEPRRELQVALRREGSVFVGGLAVVLVDGEKPDERQIRGATCAEVAEALSITVALELRPTANDEPRPPEDVSPVEVAPSPPPPEANPPVFRGRSHWGHGVTPVSEGKLELKPQFAVTLSAGASLVLFPWAVARYDATFRMASFLTLPNGEQKLVGPILRARLGFAGAPQQSFESDGASATVSGQSMGLGVCWSPLYDSAGLVLLGCAELGLAGYSTRIREAGATPRDSRITLVGTVGPVLEAEYSLGPLQLGVRVGGNGVFGTVEAQRESGEQLFRSRKAEAFVAFGLGGHW